MNSLFPRLAPGSCLGVLGGGQLGKYFVEAARRLGYQTLVLDPDSDAPAMQLGSACIVAAYDDAAALDQMADQCDAVTVEFENVPASVLNRLASRIPVAPIAEHVAIAQDRREEKRLAAQHGLALPRWCDITTAADIDAIDASLLPGILKTARLGYDGKGQAVCHTVDEVRQAWAGFDEVACVLENRVALHAELSVILARDSAGQSQAYAPAENVHRNGVLHTSVVPASLPEELQRQAIDGTRALADAIGYVGVLAVEYFVVSDGADSLSLYFNEIAPRPHNSGHWTLDASATSQFEQQARILAGLPLGDVRVLCPVVMLNVLGGEAMARRLEAAVNHPGASLNWYGKTEPRSGRKMGHVNCLADDTAQAMDTARSVHGD